jgi:S-(hydroxymethyl)glutathione dehydrogenase/alcohol dehydrogenase
VQGARLKGASRIILVEPIPYRRELAAKLGATDLLDPNKFTRKPKPVPERGFGRDDDRYDDTLVEHIRDMCKPSTDRTWAGGGRVGPDHVIEAVGGDRMKPKEVQGPDPSGLITLAQAWELCSRVGTYVTCSFGHKSDLMMSVPAEQWSDGAKHLWTGTDGGTNDRRDVPRFVRLMETGQLNMKALVSKTYPLSQATEAYQVCADRTVVATVVTPNA